MMRRTTTTFDFPIRDVEDSTEFRCLIEAIRAMNPDGDVTGEAIKSDVFQITIETVWIP